MSIGFVLRVALFAPNLRGLRTSTTTRTITQIVWVIVVAGVSLVFLGPIFIGAQNPFVQTLITSLFSDFILMNLLALVHLARPFTGEFAVAPNLYVDFIEETMTRTTGAATLK